MDIINLIGYILLASPFIVIFIHIGDTDGWDVAVKIYSTVFGLLALVGLGLYLVSI